jgi:energy-coupling factor transporter ATP-binding protein EcfA2
MDRNAITVSNLTFTYAGAKNPSLKEINLEIKEGEFVLITGPIGAGKSTLVKCLTGLIPNVIEGEMKGEVRVQEFSTKEHEMFELARIIGAVFEDPDSQLFGASVEDTVAFGPENLNLPIDEINKRVDWALKVTRLEELRHKPPFDLSGGEKQAVVIASALAMQPKILILDEPTSQLDPIGTQMVFSTLTSLHKRLGITIILVEQKVERVAPFINRFILMDEGRVILDGNLRNIVQSNFEVLKKHGVKLSIPEIFYELRKKLRTTFEVPLTVDEAISLIKGL